MTVWKTGSTIPVPKVSSLLQEILEHYRKDSDGVPIGMTVLRFEVK
jgi:hypothetical protein